METIASIVGAISGTLSFLGIIYVIGYWKGTVDTKLNSLGGSIIKYPPAETALMCKTMWEIYVVDALRQHPELAQHSSPFKLTQQGTDLIPEHLKLSLEKITRNPMDREAVASGWLVVKHLGISVIEQLAREKSLTVQETIAILSTYLDAHGNNCTAR